MNEINDLNINNLEMLKYYLKNNYSKYISSVIINDKILQIKGEEENDIISIEKDDIDNEITIFYYSIHWHNDDYEETILSIDDIIKNNNFVYVYIYYDESMEKWLGGGLADSFDEIISIENIINWEKPYKKIIKNIKIKQWNKPERIFKRMDNEIFEEFKYILNKLHLTNGNCCGRCSCPRSSVG